MVSDQSNFAEKKRSSIHMRIDAEGYKTMTQREQTEKRFSIAAVVFGIIR